MTWAGAMVTSNVFILSTGTSYKMKKTFGLQLIIFLILLLTASCRKPDGFGFYQPITMSLTVPDGPPEYKAGWHDGCKSALANSIFANSFVYQTPNGPDVGNGVYQHDPVYQSAWGQAWFSCVLPTYGFVQFNSMKAGPLE